ncbi:hypothetical protein A2V47_05030 [Candidatus Atribacteria bacterium RBG_19FT_COMBO_35_14]|uniref:Uncharacterized protein n=1 Tax=Candidatus Sediminicultor quintus TaxID=1797291 RepID=A0A1F5AAQ4_9BACT|nr:MAG: hypothetical protein A2V47_05030 [Candidatus Atribacteria bacterium RBG_19FT_COMBO_35_14]
MQNIIPDYHDLFDGTKLEPQEPMFGGMSDFFQDMPDFGEAGESMTQEDMEAMMEGLMEIMEGNEAFQDMMKEK